MNPTESQPRIPLLVLGGFLGAGKTTLLQHLLEQSEGLRWLALVNDFGEINLDAALIAQRHADTIALTNGCVCCSMGGDLSQALITVLARHPWPQAIVIEASGVSDPWRIAQIGMAAPELMLDAVVVVVDSASLARHVSDPLLADTLSRPLAHADLVLLNKADLADAATLAAAHDWLKRHAPQARVLETVHARVPLSLLTHTAQPRPAASLAPHDAHHHPAHDVQFATWTAQPECVFNEAQLAQRIQSLPRNVLRIKGHLRTERGWRQLQFAGTRVRWSDAPPQAAAQLVAIGLKPDFEGALLSQVFAPDAPN